MQWKLDLGDTPPKSPVRNEGYIPLSADRATRRHSELSSLFVDGLLYRNTDDVITRSLLPVAVFKY